MPAIETILEAILSDQGPLARTLPGYRPRAIQLQMAMRVQAALSERATLLVEAGTGIGKTFAYLIPALLSGLRVLISTGTRTLQDQLFHRDLPQLSAALGRPARVELLKGRANYLCLARLAEVGRQAELLPVGADLPGRPSAALLEWAASSRDGDLAAMPELGEEHPWRARLSSTRDSCTGMRCAHYASCHLFAARRAAQEADIVVVNHHLLLADMALKEDGYGDLLPSVDALILDEAHQLPDLASEFFGTSLSTRQLEALLTDLRQALRLAAAHSPALALHARELPAALQTAVQDVRGAVGAARARAEAREGERHIAWAELAPDAERRLLALQNTLDEQQQMLSHLQGPEPSLESLLARTAVQADALRQILEPQIAGARSVTADARGVALRLLPYEIAERFSSYCRQTQAAWIFTSATLAVAGDFSHFAGRLGLDGCETLCLASPFDYQHQGLLYLPRGLPEPAQPGYVEALMQAVLPLIEAAEGGAFLLFTSHRALRQAAAWLGGRLATHWPLLVQGEAPREVLLRRFRASGNAVLLGSASFWEGVDVQGAALRLVAIDKLPFASPDDPVVRARIEHLQSKGASAFRGYQLPEAVLALKQGVGRLIRSEEDFGVVMIGDPRLHARAYGRLFLQSLPPMPVTQEQAEACARLILHRRCPRCS
ncbi:MAG TPA: ATP-dependent DNA helicase [Steroidobacteraceae bacterium]|nr:ATP-dependent DNA helicase [Steroidobacteraceae bacterium]